MRKILVFSPEKLTDAMQSVGYDHEKMAKELYKVVGLDITRNTIKNYQNGRTVPSANILALVAGVLKKRIEYFFVPRNNLID